MLSNCTATWVPIKSNGTTIDYVPLFWNCLSYFLVLRFLILLWRQKEKGTLWPRRFQRSATVESQSDIDLSPLLFLVSCRQYSYKRPVWHSKMASVLPSKCLWSMWFWGLVLLKTIKQKKLSLLNLRLRVCRKWDALASRLSWNVVLILPSQSFGFVQMLKASVTFASFNFCNFEVIT